jgi:hypothetical protein
MKFYLASRWARRDELRCYRDVMERFGYEVTSRWLAPDGQVEVSAVHDVEDVRAATALILFTNPPDVMPPPSGAHVEFGLAMAQHKHLAVVGPIMNVFHTLPEVQRFEDWDDIWTHILADYWPTC